MDEKLTPTFRRCHLPWEETRYLAFVIEDLFSEEECTELIQRAEGHGFEKALVNIGGGRQELMSDYRKSDRCILDDPQQAERIWQRILRAIDQLDEETRQQLEICRLQTPVGGWSPVGLNERLRFLKYNPGDFFDAHSDGSYVRDYDDIAGPSRRGETSFVTFQLYLNTCSGGGETGFPGPDQQVYRVPCKAGSVLLFEHLLYHEGCEVTSGQKYAIRSDVMYTDKGKGQEYSVKPIVLASKTRK
jgi:hypothetical protein